MQMKWILFSFLTIGCVSNGHVPKPAIPRVVPGAEPIVENDTKVQKEPVDPCMAQSAFELGQSQSSFEVKQCPLAVRSKVRRAFETGKEVAVIQREIKAAEKKAANLRAKIQDPQTPGYERRKMQTTAKQVEHQIRRSERELYDLQRGY